MNFYISGNEEDLKKLIQFLKITRKEMKCLSKANDNHEIIVALKQEGFGHLTIDDTETKYNKEFEVK